MPYKRSRLLYTILALGLILQAIQLTFVGCSHTSPYYHSDIPIIEQQDVKVEEKLLYRILLIGDCGQPKQDEPVLKTLQTWAEKEHEKTSIIFLGDNMYPEGMTQRKRHEITKRLVPQLKVIKTANVHGLFIPGNHDWSNGKKYGLNALLAQEKYINDALTRPPKFLPKDGTPGPVSIELPALEPVVRVIVLDTQWWLHQNEKPEKSSKEIISELIALMDTELPIIVVGHHPLQSYGVHGGFFDWKAHLFPFRLAKKWLWIPAPIVGSLYPFSRWYLVKSVQDLNNVVYKDMIRELNSAFTKSKKDSLFIYASGHEHSLQVLKGENVDYHLISGLGSSEKATEVSHGQNTLFAHQHTGFMSVDFLANGSILLRVVEPREADVVFHQWLK